MIRLANRMENIHSDIRGPLYREALKMQEQGIDVLKLNTGNPAAFGFTLPDSIRNALVGREDEAVAYCDFQGMPAARRAIIDYCIKKGIEDVEPEDSEMPVEPGEPEDIGDWWSNILGG
jgi:alanine-synthesizing transaminase